MSDADQLDYFRHVRRDIEHLLPSSASRILEIGCGAGATLAWLKARWPEAYAVGIDGYPPVEHELSRRVDTAMIHDLEEPLPDLGTFDLILALDVLEHLRQPETIMKRLVSMLRPEGSVIVSVPNIAHHKILLPLLFRRRFRYVDAGILDRTHLRFFTEESAVALLRDAGLKVTGGVAAGAGGAKSRILDRLSFGRLKHYLTLQYVLRGDRKGPDRFRWRNW